MTQNFTVYDTASGRILRTGVAPLSMVALQAGAGESTLVGDLRQDLFYIGPDGPLNRPPALSLPDTCTVGAPVPMDGVGTGAAVTVIDAYGTEHAFAYDAADPLILTDPGFYLIRIDQTFPAHNLLKEMEVIDA